MLRFRREKQVHGSWVCSFLAVVLVVVVLSSSVQFGQCQLNGLAGSPSLSPDISSLATQLLYDQLSNPTRTLNDQINQHFGYCVEDSEDDWNRSFNFSSNLGFVDVCEAKINGNFSDRVCTTAEIKYYFGGLLDRTGRPSISEFSKNCNLTSWSSGCEPGWACSIGSGAIDLQNSSIIPSRTSNCQPCCEGFYCPSGLACMIPCPLGSYCPLATLNTSTGVCEPYTYQLPPGNPNHTCGGANIWADYGSSKEMFCSGGSYCPTTIQEINCSSGHYCRAGSTSEARCLSLTTCKASSASQSLKLYGAIVIVILIIILIVIYNCSDQVLTIRERRLAKSREKAANMAKEKVRARENWQVAKVAAKKYARGFQNQFSQKFSRKINFREYEETEELEMLSEIKVETDDHFYSPAHPSTSRPSEESSVSSKGKEKEDASKGRHKHNRTVIFANTYAQLEKEKALQVENKNLTFSGVISMATDTDVKRRPPIELEFNNLTLTLKGKKKHLLRCVTGNIKPGRITAVMGPSGAGKTTFLTALLGKSIGCTITGSILINGKHDSIHAYKKIIGFVPQDDIVHGNLTVEENLWFSANCRLPANIARADKVLIIERVIEYLGLHGIRDSLVGTVEKRGISGGQRKRVNVGLEMVIEPSLLILDEPTSGLDSSTSQLLIRALKREAHEGVNVCMVIHQPSYALFSMFDDLVLLAKGGFTAYLGPVKEVESYFAGLGITVPERINPPDHFIDVLEGVVKPTASGACSHNELPVRWMLHNRYVVPNDLRESVPGPIMSSTPASPAPETDHLDNEMVEHSFVRELCQDVKSKMALRKEKIMRNFKKTEDISRRRTPGVLQQYRYFLGRVGKQRLREARVQAMDYLILFLAGTCLGILAKANDESFGVLGYTNTVIAIPLLCQIAALRTFSLEKLQYWRESSSGISSLAYFLAKDTIDHFNTVVKPLVYLSMFYFFSNPRSSFTENYIVLLCLVYCVTGVAYALSIFLHPGSAQLVRCMISRKIFSLFIDV